MYAKTIHAFVQQKVLTLLPRFYVYVNGSQVAEIVKEFTLLKPKYRIAGLNWEVQGDISAGCASGGV